MPLYEYYCSPCSAQFEVLRPMSQMDNPAVCPSGHTTNNRVISLFSPILRSGDQAMAPVATALSNDACCADGGCSCC